MFGGGGERKWHEDADSSEGCTGYSITEEPFLGWGGMIQITPQMRILVAVEPAHRGGDVGQAYGGINARDYQADDQRVLYDTLSLFLDHQSLE